MSVMRGLSVQVENVVVCVFGQVVAGIIGAKKDQ
jgi:hypothetical protein